MLDLIYNTNGAIILFVIMVAVVGVCALAVVLFRFFGVDGSGKRAGENLMIINMTYAILIGFIIFAEIANEKEAFNANVKEANNVFSISRRSSFLPEPYMSQSKILIKEYLYNVLENEWPSIEKGLYNAQAQKQIHELTKLLKEYEPEGYSDSINYNNLLTSLIDLNLAHLDRVNFAVSLNLGGLVWVCLLFITAITISSNVFYIYTSRKGGTFFSFIICFVVSVIIFLIIELDYPYRSRYGVGSQQFNKVLVEISRMP